MFCCDHALSCRVVPQESGAGLPSQRLCLGAVAGDAQAIRQARQGQYLRRYCKYLDEVRDTVRKSANWAGGR